VFLTGLGALALAAPGSASAATQLGETFPPPSACDPGATNLQSSSPGGRYTIGFPGVITSWSYQAGAGTTQVKLKVARPAGGNAFRIVGESGPNTATAGSLFTFPAQIAVAAGDILGIYTSGTACGRSAPGTGYLDHYLYPGDPPIGSTNNYLGPIEWQIDISATLEPDCDGDGLGDETQDGDLGLCDTAPPDTTITKQPKDKTKKKQAEFEFTSSEPGSSFECSLDGAGFAPCISPRIEEVGKGKHVFQVRATDAAGNVDGSPAIDDWKVKKKRKRL